MDPVNLRVTEALARDVGHGNVRIDPMDMSSVGITTGDMVRLIGKRSTVVKALPAYAEDRGQGLIQMDGIVRENTQSALGERVELQPIVCPIGRTVVLQPLGDAMLGTDPKHIASVLEGLPVTPGDKVRSTLMGGIYREFSVAETTPRGAVLITSTTTVKVKGETLARPRRDFDITSSPCSKHRTAWCCTWKTATTTPSSSRWR